MERIVSFFYPDFQGAILIVLLCATVVAWILYHCTHLEE